MQFLILMKNKHPVSLIGKCFSFVVVEVVQNTTPPKYAVLVYRIFWAEGTWETTDAGRALWSPSFYLKACKISPEKSAFSVPEGEHCYHLKLGAHAKMDLYKWAC